MNNARLTLMCAAILVASMAWASCVGNLFYIDDATEFGDLDCAAALILEKPLTLHVRLGMGYRPDALVSVSFSVIDWPGNPGDPLGEVTESWQADHIAGDLASGLTLSWDAPLPPSESGGFYLGSITFLAHDPSWIEDGHTLRIEDAQIVDDRGICTGVSRSLFTFAEGLGYWCTDAPYDPPLYWREVRYIEPEDQSIVTGDFTLEFEVENWDCYNGWPWPYDGFVEVDGVQVAEFDGVHEGNHAVPIATAGLPDGTPIGVRIHVDFSGDLRDVFLSYVFDSTPLARDSFSVLKSLY